MKDVAKSQRMIRTAVLFAALSMPSAFAAESGLRDSLNLKSGLPACPGAPASPKRNLLLIGGGDHPALAMAQFVERAGGKGAEVLDITWGSSVPDEYYAYVRDELTPLGVTVTHAPSTATSAAWRPEFLADLARAKAVFFSGGDQVLIMDVLKDKELLEALRRRYREGVVFGGTSAGMAIMSDIMITGEGDFSVIDAAKVETRPGLGLLPGVILDQHFIKRQRENRLFGLVLKHTELLGVGVNEGASLFVEDDAIARAIGGQAMVVKAAGSAPARLALDILEPGACYDLKNRKHLN
jgi:cyanophycinase